MGQIACESVVPWWAGRQPPRPPDLLSTIFGFPCSFDQRVAGWWGRPACGPPHRWGGHRAGSSSGSSSVARPASRPAVTPAVTPAALTAGIPAAAALAARRDSWPASVGPTTPGPPSLRSTPAVLWLRPRGRPSWAVRHPFKKKTSRVKDCCLDWASTPGLWRETG